MLPEILIGLSLAVVAGAGLWWWRRRAAVATTEQRHRLRVALDSRGVKGVAEVVGVERVRIETSGDPRVRLRLSLRGTDVAPHELEAERVVYADDLTRLAPGKLIALRYDPENPANFELGLDASTTLPGEEDEDIAATAAPFETPLWIFGQKGAETWMLPPRDFRRPRVVVVDFSDPHNYDLSDEREWTVDSAAFVLAEALWLHTDVVASAAVMVDLDKRRIVQPTGPLVEFEDLQGLLESLDYDPIVIWGAAGKELGSDGMTIKIRMPGETADRTLTAPLGQLMEDVVGWLVGRDLAGRVEPPPWYQAPAGPLLPRYCKLLRELQLQLLADRRNGMLTPLRPPYHQRIVDEALDAAEEFARAGQVRLIAVASAAYAARCGALTDEHHTRLEQMVTAADADEVVRRIAPHVLAMIGDQTQAQSLRTSALSEDPDDDYRMWLERVVPASGDAPV